LKNTKFEKGGTQLEIKIGKDGFYMPFNTKLFKGFRKIKVNPQGEDLKEKIELAVGKIPAEILGKAVLLINMLHKHFKTEILITINFDPKEKKWYIDVPKQNVTSTSVNFTLTTEEYDKIVMEIHSHPGNGETNFSGTDSQDQGRKMRLYGVFNPLTIEDPFGNSINISDVFEMPKDIEELFKLALTRITDTRANQSQSDLTNPKQYSFKELTSYEDPYSYKNGFDDDYNEIFDSCKKWNDCLPIDCYYCPVAEDVIKDIKDFKSTNKKSKKYAYKKF